MPALNQSVAALRVHGDFFCPQYITHMLGCEPTYTHSKGETGRSEASGSVWIRRHSIWTLSAEDRKPADLDAQVAELLGKLTQDLSVWEALRKEHEIDLFVGFFMAESNEGITLPPETLLALGQRGIMIEFDIYDPGKELLDDDPCPYASGLTYGKCCKVRLYKTDAKNDTEVNGTVAP
ncbi:DUF4279 domain-containing protein [Fundidesulfovibrio soli]|uniref:DUF4279 domain-containing protein n=1 Tax=Fundidesulfovibrio soli TaxID=2922716 RepID=UPI001FAFB789|nr:DUF4279 domain-containing protein [Fundidesulfovibrio soli]